MKFEIIFTDNAVKQFKDLERSKNKSVVFKALKKTLGLMEVNLRYPSLNTHEFKSIDGPHGEKMFESYVQNKTPGAYRIFWYYGPKKGCLTITSIIPHTC